MKILQIHTSMTGGGIQSVVCALSNEMANRGEDVTACSISKVDDGAVFWNKLSPSVRKHTMNKKGGGFSFSILFKIYAYIKEERFEVVNIHGFFCYYLVAVFLLHNKVSFFYTLHSDAKKENGKWDSRFLFLKRFCFLSGWVRPITISDASKDSFEGLYNCCSTLIYNGVPRPYVENKQTNIVEIVRKTEKTKIFIHVGRIDVPKNQVVLCRVFDKLISEGNDISLLLVGGKEDQAIYDQMSSYFSDRIVYAGERSDVPQLLSESYAMCLPSIWEGLPLVLLEAMSVGCVPICSPVGGIVNVLHDGWNGFLSLSSSEDDYYAKIKDFLNISDLEYQRVRKRAVCDFEKYTIENTVSNYLEAYYSCK